jgi:hypothetical protein
MAENGATPHELMAITGHKTLSEVEPYTRAANTRKLALYRCPAKAVKVQAWFDVSANDRETYISIRCPACGRVHLVNPLTGKTPADE